MAYGPQPDRPPDVPTAYDLEFTSSDLSAATELDATATQTYDSNTTIPSCLYLQSAVGGKSPGLYWTSMPAAPFTVTACIASYANPTGASVRTDVGLMLGEATPGKFIHGVTDVAENSYMTICGSKWTNPSTWSNNIGDFLNAGSGSGSRARTSGFALLRRTYVRWVVHSTSNVDGYWSFDGILYTKWLSAYNPGFTIGSFGIDLHNGDATNYADNAVAVDWIRFKETDAAPSVM